MTTTYNSLAFDEGSAVRLSYDTGAASIGRLVDVSHVRCEDGMTFWNVDLHPDREGPYLVAAESTLVPVCEHEQTYTDEWGLACSEPGVPTSFTIPCGHDAERTITFADMSAPGPFHMNLCLAHAVEYALDMETEPGVQFLDSRPIEDRQFTDAEISADTAVLNVNRSKSNRM